MKDFVLVRGQSGRLYLYDRETWLFMYRNKYHGYEFVVDSDDYKELQQMQALVNKDIEIKD